MNYDIKCYFLKDDATSSVIELQELCPGAYMLEATGLTEYGKAKNIVTESYADGEGSKVYLPDAVCREATDVSLKLCFMDYGSYGRYKQYNDFIAYVEKDLVYYWDSVRLMQVHLALVDKCTPKEYFHGQLEYIEAEVKFKNVDGYPTDLGHQWSYEWSSAVCLMSGGYNTGIARYKTVTFSKVDSAITETFTITDAFDGYPAINDVTYAALNSDSFGERLSAFNDIVVEYMRSHRGDYGTWTLNDITNGVMAEDHESCPITPTPD